MSRRARGRALAVVGVLVLAPLRVVDGQTPEGGWRVISADLTAELDASDGSADVEIRYVLAADATSASGDRAPVLLELLGFGEATAERVSVNGGGEVVLWPTVGTHRSAAIGIVDGGGVERTALTLRYRVERAVERSGATMRVVVPVVTGPGAPAAGEAGFTARLIVPDGWTPSEGFPSGLRADTDGAYVTRLPVVPAMVGFRGRTDGAWRPGLPLVLDLLTLLILMGFSVVGWRHLRRLAQERAA